MDFLDRRIERYLFSFIPACRSPVASANLGAMMLETKLPVAVVLFMAAVPWFLACGGPTPPSVNQHPVIGRPWTNSLGAKFVAAGTPGVLFCVWDVRVQDFQAYAQATGFQPTGGMGVMKVVADAKGVRVTNALAPDASWEHPGFEQDPTHPVVGISWNEAKAFCQWLTAKERREGMLGLDQSYRLPTDAEWTTAAGDGKYPWGDAWPPPKGAGNYADEAFISSLVGVMWPHLPGNDGYARTSPVGSFRANAFGLYDMGGNVWQWCEDLYEVSKNSDGTRRIIPEASDDGGGTQCRALRGASWANGMPAALLSSFHNTRDPDGRMDDDGFRLVVVVSP